MSTRRKQQPDVQFRLVPYDQGGWGDLLSTLTGADLQSEAHMNQLVWKLEGKDTRKLRCVSAPYKVRFARAPAASCRQR